MRKIKQSENAEVFVIHFGGKPLHMVKGQWNDWTPPKKVYYTISAAKTGMNYIPHTIRDLCEIIRYTPDNI